MNVIAGLFGLTVDAFPWELLRYQHIEAILNKLDQSPRTIERKLSTLRNIARESRKLGYMTLEEFASIEDIKAPGGDRPLAGRVLNIAEIDKLLKVCVKDGSPLAIRDGCIIALMYLCGLRRFEIAGIQLQDLGEDELLVRGKGDNQETVPILDGAKDWLKAYLRVRGLEPGPLFYRNRPRTSDLIPESIYPKVVERMVYKRAAQAGVKDVHTHDFRRSLCTHLLELSIDIFTVAKISRHKNLDVLRRYDRRTDEEKRKALRKIHVVSP
jgi:integrase